MGTFTQGEWKYSQKENKTSHKITITCEDSDIAFLLKHVPELSEALKTSARLIAAAPEMYRLLKEEVSGRAWNWDIHGCAIITENYIDERRKLLDLIDGKEAKS